MNAATPAASAPWETHRALRAWIVVVFVVALAVHFHLATRNWKAGFMPGHEFRQAHTALISHYIDAENNFTPLYSVPLFGKPWVAPLEFPLYEWAVVGLSRATGWTHLWAARAVTLACFYLMLPAVYLLLAQLGWSRLQRLLALVPVLACPVYIFYSRAFLMESMVLMFSVWFLLGFVRTMRGIGTAGTDSAGAPPESWRPRPGWAVVSAIAGTGAGLIKSTTFFVWLAPAACYGGWCLYCAFRSERRGRLVVRTLGWGLGTATLPCAAVIWWVKYTDALKLAHPSAHVFASKTLTTGSFGLYDAAARFSPAMWKTLGERWSEAIAAPWLVLAWIALALLLDRQSRRVALIATPFFFLAQILFPFAYGYQEYYFYACTVFVLVAAGAALNGILATRLPVVLRALLVLAIPAALLANYRRVYYEIQNIPSHGGLGLTQAIRMATPKESVIIVIGDDWCPIIPFYSQRRALMVRSSLENDPAYLARAFDDLEGEKIGALVMARAQKERRDLATQIAERFGLDRSPTFTHPVGDVYLAKEYREAATIVLAVDEFGQSPCDGVKLLVQPAPAAAATASAAAPVIPPELATAAFSMVEPAPVAYQFTYGFRRWPFNGREVLGVHPDSDLEVVPPAGAKQIVWEFGLIPEAYEREGDKSNGVEFTIMVQSPSGERRRIFQRIIEPVIRPTDRGTLREQVPYSPAAGERLVFLVRSNGDLAYDWAYTQSIQVR